MLLYSLISACASAAPSITVDVPTETNPSQPPTEVPTDIPTELPATETPNSPAESPEPTISVEPVAYGPSNFPPDVDPITGEKISNPELLDRRPLSVKVQIFPRGQRPAWGVSLADVVYDFYQNNGLTRLHAVFYGQDAETVGPIRSARLPDVAMVKMYKSIFAFGSAESRTINRLYGTDFADRLVMEGYGKCPPMCRVDPNGFNYLVANTSELSNYAIAQGIDNSRQNLDGMSFNQLAPQGGQFASQVYVRVSISAYTRWDYDAINGKYMRFQDTVEAYDLAGEAYDVFTDRLTGQQVKADNVVVIMVPYSYAYGTSPGPGEVIDINLSGKGKAYAYREGQVYEVEWNRPTNDSVLYLTFPDGSPYAFKPGKTWFHVIGQSSKVETPESGIWRFQMMIP